MSEPPGIKARLAADEVLVGTFAALGSSAAVEAVACAGLDFVIIDLEHGAGDESAVLAQSRAAERGGAHALVRVESAVRERTTRMLDLGAEGVICPRVSSAVDAEAWAASLRYGNGPGARGVALGTRGAGYGLVHDALARAADRTLGVVQIETPEAVEQCERIAAIDGVDVLFVGPTDLSHALGCLRDWEHPALRAATTRVVSAARAAGKVAGTHCATADRVPIAVDDGFRLVAAMSDGALLIAGAARTVELAER
jgi:2-keto-3-deoxy-L-rhamnonate aldolase RhmA